MQSSNHAHFWKTLLVIGVLLLSTLACASEDEPIPTDETDAVKVENAPPADAAAPDVSTNQGTPGTWLVMLYQDADDETLEQDILIDLNEAEMVGSTDDITIVSQIDRLDGGYDGDGDWNTAKRFLVTQDSDLSTIASQELEDLGEVDMGDMNTLVDFATWAIQSYPADRYVLILSDHGMGWPGGWSDDDPNEGSEMSMESIDKALTDIIKQTGIGQFELLGFDACLMAQVESLTAITPHARYAVASQETEPALGWAYGSFLGSLAENPGMSGADLSRAIVDSYITQDFRVVDDEARRVFVEENFESSSDLSAEQVAEEMSLDVTLTAVDLSQMSALNGSLNDFILALAAANPEAAAAARAYAQGYTNIFGKEEDASYFDLGHFAALAAEQAGDDNLQAASEALMGQIQKTVLAEKHGPQRPGSTGFSIFFPNSQLYTDTFIEYAEPYSATVSRFAAASLWDDYLTYYYTGSQIDPSSSDLMVLEPEFPAQQMADLAEKSNPQPGAEVVSPGAGGITVDPLEISADTISADGTLTVSTTVSGANVAYIYYYSEYYNEEDGSYLTADVGFVAAESVKQLDGVTYPDWGDGDIEIEIDWEPTLYFLSDGNEANDQFALFEPEVYGATPEEDVYTVYGVYAYLDSQETREAMIQFDGNGEMKSVWVFTGEDEASAPREATPKPGDTFTIWEEWLEFDEASQDWVYNYYKGGVMTFGDTPFTMTPYTATAGQYSIGIIAVDFDGNLVEEYAEVTVTE